MDARKTLNVLREEWRSCTRCELGQRRIAHEGEFVFGEGAPRGVMFIGAGPSKDEEISGRPFSDDRGMVLRKIIQRFGLQNYYLTNIVTCRACSPWTDASGEPILRKNWKTKQMEISYKDEPPTPPQIEACLPRLHEQIYLVDPVVIVTLGGVATKALLKKHVAITSDDVRGQAFHISIPGAGHRTVRTEKKEAWIRVTAGRVQMPIEQSEVRYLCIPTIDLDLVLKKIADQSGDSPFQKFGRDIQKAIKVYERYMLEIFGTIPSGAADTPLLEDDVFE